MHRIGARAWRFLHSHMVLTSLAVVRFLPVIGANALFQVDAEAALSQVAPLREHGA